MIELFFTNDLVTYNQNVYAVHQIEDASDGVRISLQNQNNLFTLRLFDADTKINGAIASQNGGVFSQLKHAVTTACIGDKIYSLLNTDEFKKYAKDKLDESNEILIANGFVFDGITFSLSMYAQINISNIPNMPDADFPFVYLGKNEEFYELQLNKKTAFYLTALNTIKSVRILNDGLKLQALELTTLQELKDFKELNNL